MLKVIVFLTVVAACYGAPSTNGTHCGATPYANELYNCVSLPSLVSHDAFLKCHDSTTSECDEATCLLRESKLLEGTALNKTKMTSFFSQFAEDHPEWSPAVQRLKAVCLDHELKAQGVDLNCPAYDVMYCALSSFIKKAAPSQWSTTGNCTYLRAYIASCPMCPKDCFAPLIPSGSCNACIARPQHFEI